MIRKVLLVSIVYLGLLGQGSAQTRSLTLDEIFQLADRHNNRIRVYDLAISEAEQGIKVACNDRLPSIQAHVDLKYIGDGVMTDRNFSHAVHADMPHFGNSFIVKASQVVYAGGAITKGIKQSRLQKQEAELEYIENRQDVRFLLAGYYLDLFQLNNQKRVYESNISQTRLLVKDMKASYRQGTALKSDITRYELQLQSLELSLTSVKDKIDVLSHKLATAVGLEPDVLILPDTTELLKFNVENRTEEDWLLEIHHTPSVRLADIRIEQEKNKQDLIRAERRPQISLVAANDFAGPILVEVPPLDNNFTYWYAGIGISYNLDALFKSKKKLKQAQFATRKMEEARKLAEEEAENDIHAAYVNLNEAYIRLRTQKKSVQLAEAALNLTKLNLSYTVICATADGVTGRKNIHEGELVQSGQTLVTLVDGTEKWVIANYKETQTTDMKQGQLVEMTVDAIPGVTYQGQIISISDATGSFYSLIPQDNSAGNFVKVEQRIPVRIEFTHNNSEENLSRLRAGMNVECYVKLQ